MRKTTIHLMTASLAACAMSVPTMLGAQDQTLIEEVSLTEEQQAVFDSWAPDQQIAYNSWPSETKNYFWSLSPDRQGLFWRLTDEDKLAITAMTGPEREKAWSGIEAAAGGGSAAETGPDDRIN